MEILLDTSFILTCVKEKVDFLKTREFGQLLLPEEVLKELRKKSKGNSRDSENAKTALEVINRNKEKFWKVKLNEDYVDKGILNWERGAVATMDKELKEKLKKRKRKILTLRGRKKIVIM